MDINWTKGLRAIPLYFKRDRYKIPVPTYRGSRYLINLTSAGGLLSLLVSCFNWQNVMEKIVNWRWGAITAGGDFFILSRSRCLVSIVNSIENNEIREKSASGIVFYFARLTSAERGNFSAQRGKFWKGRKHRIFWGLARRRREIWGNLGGNHEISSCFL